MPSLNSLWEYLWLPIPTIAHNRLEYLRFLVTLKDLAPLALAGWEQNCDNRRPDTQTFQAGRSSPTSPSVINVETTAVCSRELRAWLLSPLLTSWLQLIFSANYWDDGGYQRHSLLGCNLPVSSNYWDDGKFHRHPLLDCNLPGSSNYWNDGKFHHHSLFDCNL